MKYTHIVLTDQGMLALNGGVCFKPDSITGRWDNAALENYYGGMKKNQIYPIPDGYEVRVVDDYSKPHGFEKYAILVPNLPIY